MLMKRNKTAQNIISFISLLFFIFTFYFLSASCKPEKTRIEKIMEDGVEVVVNHLEPYKIKGEPNELSLVHAFTMDMEDPSILNLGLTDIWIFDVDSQGNIFIFQSTNKDSALVFKFDPNGNFLMSFGRMGQEPFDIIAKNSRLYCIREKESGFKELLVYEMRWK